MVENELIAKLCCETLKFKLGPKSDSSDLGVERPAIRVKTLLPEEIKCFLSEWERETNGTPFEKVRVLIASDAEIDVDIKFRADPKHSITYYRNHNDQGLVYIHTKNQSDEESQKNIFTIRERNLLDGSLDEAGQFNAEEKLISICWEAANGKSRPKPGELNSKMTSIRTFLERQNVPVGLRQYISFVYGVCKRLSTVGGAGLDEGSQFQAVGESLESLGMFPDPDWSDSTADSRRLILNYRLSDGQNPGGIDQEDVELIQRIDETRFKDRDGNPQGAEEGKKNKELCLNFVRNRSFETRSCIEFWVYQQLFASEKAAGVPLGEKVDAEIEAAEHDLKVKSGEGRVEEFRSLGIIDALNDKEQDTARYFLEYESDKGLAPLSSLIKDSTAKILKKIAYPAARKFKDPFTQIVNLLKTSDNPKELEGATLLLKPGRDAENFPHLMGLFSFLYSKSLEEIAEASSVDSGSVALRLDSALTKIRSVPELPDLADEDMDDEDPKAAPVWDAGLPISIECYRVNSEGKKEVIDLAGASELLWLPDDVEWLAMLWILLCADDAPSQEQLLGIDGADYAAAIEGVVQRRQPAGDFFETFNLDQDVSEHSVIKELLCARSDFRTSVTKNGFSISDMNEYVSRWQKIVSDARSQFVPNGSLDTRLNTVISFDVINWTNSALMLGFHPLRLRWLARYLTELKNVCILALGFALETNPGNEDFYLSCLSSLSPHSQPPVLANSSRTLMVPVAEHGFSELFAAIKREGASTAFWKAELDSVSLGVISNEIDSYLNAHPYKEDGLKLLFLMPSGGDFPKKLVESIRKNNARDIPIHCHVFCPKAEWDPLIASFQRLHTDNRIKRTGLLNPPIQLFLMDLDSPMEAAKKIRNEAYDITVVPNFFGDRVEVNEFSEQSVEQLPGQHHVLYDHSEYIDRDADAGAVSIVLKPRLPDELLCDWSTMNVRLLRSEAISPDKPDNIDFVKLKIRFEDAEDLFSAIHEASHWVITLDHYVGRDQIESLPNRPDVLNVKEGVGQNNLYTLIVSSSAGKEFVIKRLARKISRLTKTSDNVLAEDLAKEVYDEIRGVAPSLILRSLGLSRITEEVIGVMIGKRIAEREYLPEDPANTVSIWISLDEHLEWFRGGISADRADLCRIDFSRINGRLAVGLLVLEAKLRKSYDSHGVDQVERTLALLRFALQPKNENGESPDARYWRQSILNAINSVSDSAVVSTATSSRTDRISHEDLDSFREGDYQLLYCRGMYSNCLYETQTKQRSKEGEVDVFRVGSEEIFSLLRQRLSEVSTPSGSGDIAEELNKTDDKSVLDETSDTKSVAGAKMAANGAPEVPATRVGTSPLGRPPEVNPANDVSIERSVRGMPEVEMRRMYQKILDCLEEFDVNVETPNDGLPEFVEGPASVKFRLKTGRGVRPDKIIGESNTLHNALELEHHQSLHFTLDRGTVNIDVPKKEEDRYYVSTEEMWKKCKSPDGDAFAIPLGENQEGEIISIDFSSSRSPHLLIGGETGSGKSEALNTILYGMIHFYSPEQVQLVLVDPKQVELASFEGMPHVRGPIRYADTDAVEALEQAVQEMQERYTLFRDHAVRSLSEYNNKLGQGRRLPRIVVVLDEYADLVAEPEAKKAIEKNMGRLSAKARACGIHVIIATQKPSAETLSTTIRSNLPAQLALKCRGRQESVIVMGEAGAESLNGKGDAYLKIEGRLERVQCGLYKGPKALVDGVLAASSG